MDRRSSRPSARARRPAAPAAAARAPVQVRGGGAEPRSWRKERRRGAIAAAVICLVFVALMSGYGLHAHMAQAEARAAARDMQIAIETGAALNNVAVLFVPEYGAVCRRRWIDNTTWSLRDGGQVDCEEAAGWHVNAPIREHKVERRIGAIRETFQTRAPGKVE
ncbi:MAG TPA: hypothetical protein VNZ93_12265 [Pseudorhodoplanes sp.]|nr:hypothetical protein [Pseudorhodoplanes sp.]